MGQVIALSGWKGSGKDFAADYLVGNYGFRRLALADVLKEMVADLFNIPISACHDRILKETGITKYPVRAVDPFSETIHTLLATELQNQYWTPRAMCILLGSICRSVDPNFWVQRVVDTIKKDPMGRYVITDVRYQNEVQVLRQQLPGITLARVLRAPGPGTADPSENDLNDYVFPNILDNRGSALDYYRQLDVLVDREGMGSLPDGSTIIFGT